MTPENPSTALVITSQSPALARVSNQLTLTNKLLTKPEAPFLIPYRKDDKWGFCDRNKNIAIDCVYDGVKLFSEGLALVWNRNNEFDGVIDYMYINSSNVIEIKYSASNICTAGSFHDGAAICGFSNSYGYINRIGRSTSSVNYDDVNSFSEGLGSVQIRETGKYGFINNIGNIILRTNYDFAHPFSESLSSVVNHDDRTRYFIDKYLDRIISIKCYHAAPFSSGLSLVESLEKKFGFINKFGEVVIPMIYDDAHSFIEDIAAVKIGGLWKYINKVGDVVLSTSYEHAHSFSQGIATVEVKTEDQYTNKLRFINMEGQEVLITNFDVLAIKDRNYVITKNGCVEFLSEYHMAFWGNLFSTNSGYIDKEGVEYWIETLEYKNKIAQQSFW